MEDTDKEYVVIEEDFLEDEEIYIKIPTLEELIEQCGRIVLWSYKGLWYVAPITPEREECGELGKEYVDVSFNGDIGEGATPSEAVARLGIALHGKKGV